MRTLKQIEAIAIQRLGDRAMRVRVLVEMNAADFAALIADGGVDSSGIGQHTLDQVTRALTVEGSS